MATEQPEFITSKRSGFVLSYMGFEYHRTGRYKDSTYWVCAKSPECNARAPTKRSVSSKR